MKRRIIIFVLLFCLALSACSADRQSEAPPEDETPSTTPTMSSPSANEQPDHTDQVLDPGFVYLPVESEIEVDEDYVFRGSISMENGEDLNYYLDTGGVDNVIAMDTVCGNGGETVSVPLRVCGDVELCAVDLEISYDADQLKYIGFENADDDLIVNCKENGTILVNFVRIVNLEDNFRFCDLLFEVITTLECESVLDIEIVEAVCLDDTGSIVFPAVAVADGAAHLNGKGG